MSESPITSFNRDLAGSRVAVASKGVGTFLTFDLDSSDRVHIWIQYCDWVLLQGHVRLLSSSDHSDRYPDILARLGGLRFEGVQVDQSSASLNFADGYSLQMAANLDDYDSEDDLFVIYRDGLPPIAFCPSLGIYVSE